MKVCRMIDLLKKVFLVWFFFFFFGLTWSNNLLVFFVLCFGLKAKFYALLLKNMSVWNYLLQNLFFFICVLENNELAVSAMLADSLCWLHGYSLYFSFLLPVGLILIVNITIFIIVLKHLFWTKREVLEWDYRINFLHIVIMNVPYLYRLKLCLFFYFVQSFVDSRQKLSLSNVVTKTTCKLITLFMQIFKRTNV